jgi:tetratricopeptide (TPR) repeat protein
VAVVWFIRATIFAKRERAADGAALARQAAAVFRDYGDDFREMSANLAEGGCRLVAGAVHDAAAVFERLIGVARVTGQRNILAYALQDAGISYTAAGEYKKAMSYLTAAYALFDELGLTTEKARAMWQVGSLLVRCGELSEGIPSLAASREELRELGLTGDAALATLEWAEARLAAGQPEGVAEACRAIRPIFQLAGLSQKANTALACVDQARSALTPKSAKKR